MGYPGCGMFGICDFRDVGCWGCGMFGMWYVGDVGCWVREMSEMWDVQDVGCLLECEMLIYKMPIFQTVEISEII